MIEATQKLHDSFTVRFVAEKKLTHLAMLTASYYWNTDRKSCSHCCRQFDLATKKIDREVEPKRQVSLGSCKYFLVLQTFKYEL